MTDAAQTDSARPRPLRSLLSALLALTRALVGPMAGGLTERMGYAKFFLLTFVLALPGFALLPALRRVPSSEA